MVHIRVLQPDQSLLDDSALMGDKHPGSANGLGEYGVSKEPITDNSSQNHSSKKGVRRPKSN